MLAKAPRGATLDGIIRAKREWKVLAKALAYRCLRFNSLTEWQYRSIFIELARRGFTQSESLEIPREASQVLAQAFAWLRDEKVTNAVVARELCLPVQELDTLIFGQMTPVTGGSNGTPDRPAQESLRLV